MVCQRYEISTQYNGTHYLLWHYRDFDNYCRSTNIVHHGKTCTGHAKPGDRNADCRNARFQNCPTSASYVPSGPLVDRGCGTRRQAGWRMPPSDTAPTCNYGCTGPLYLDNTSQVGIIITFFIKLKYTNGFIIFRIRAHPPH